MFRKIVLGIVITLALAVAGGWMFLRTQGDVILQKFSHLVEKNTGKPLHMETLPEISLFPGLSLTLGPSSWGEQEDARFRFLQPGKHPSFRFRSAGRTHGAYRP